MMHHLLDTISHYLRLHPTAGIIFAFFAAFLESLPIIGLVIPGSVLMTAVGAMIGAGWLPGYLTLGIATLGAFMGDIAGFLIGYVFKDNLRRVWPFKQHPKIIAFSTEFIAAHGGKSVLIGRFVGAARSAVPMVAGLLRLSWARFLLAALPTAILWTVVYTVPGILLGAFSLTIPPKLLTEYLIIGIVIISLLWLCYWLLERSFSKIKQHYDSYMGKCWRFLQHRCRKSVTRYLCNQQDPSCHLQFNRCVMLIIFSLLFAITAIIVLLKTHLSYSMNLSLFDFSQSLRLYHLDSFFVVITLMGSPYGGMMIGIALSGFLALMKQWWASVHLLAGTLIAVITVFGIKSLYFNPRPSGFMLVLPSSSFPSGHAGVTLVVFGLITFFTANYFKKHRGTLYTAAGTFIALVAFSRLYLGAHWFLDVMAASFLGLAILLFVIISYQRLPNRHASLNIRPLHWILVSVLVTLSVWSITIYHGYKKTLYSTTPFQQKSLLSIKDWWEQPLDYVPAYRNNRFGFPIQPLNIEWVGNLDHIKKLLLTHQWKLINEGNNVKETIQRLSSPAPQYHLPLFDLLYYNQRPALTFYKLTSDQSTIYTLRLWDSHIELRGHGPLWIGMLNKELSPNKKTIGLHTQRISFSAINAPELLFNGTRQVSWQLILEDPSLNTHLQTSWDGKIWLFLAN